MIYLFLLVSIVFSSLCSMDRQVSVVSVDSDSRRHSPFGDVESAGSTQHSSDEDDLCDFAMSRYLQGIPGIDRYLKPFLKPLLHDAPLSPDLRHSSSNADILRAAKNSVPEQKDEKLPSSMSISDQRMYDMIVKAMHGAVEEKEKVLIQKERELALREARIKQKYSGKKTAAIAAITGTVSTIVTTICATMVSLNSK